MKNILFYMLIGAFIAALVNNYQYEKENNRLQNEIYKLKNAYSSAYLDGLTAQPLTKPAYDTWWVGKPYLMNNPGWDPCELDH